MIGRHIGTGIVLTILFGWTMGVSGQVVPDLLSLDQAVKVGLQHNPGLQAAHQNTASARWAERRAYTRWMPKVAANSGYTRLDKQTVRRANVFTDIGRQLGQQFGGPGFDPEDIKPAAYRNTYSTSVSVIQPIYNGGAEWAGIRMARSGHQASEYALRNTEQEVVLKIKQAYFNVLKAQELVHLMKEAAASTREHVTHVERMYKVGMRNRADVLRWEVQRAEDEGNIVQAENGLAIAKAALNEAMGVPLEMEYTLEPIAEEDHVQGDLSAEEIAQAVRTHPSVQATQAAMDLQKASVHLAWSGFQPKVNFAYIYSWEQDDDLRPDGDKTWSASVQVHFPIFSSLGDYVEVKKAKADLRMAEATVQQVKQGIYLQATSAALNVKAARTRIEIARKAVEHAEENVRVVQSMYEVGTVSNIDFIDAQLAHTGARINAINALYDFYIAEAALERALGRGEETAE